MPRNNPTGRGNSAPALQNIPIKKTKLGQAIVARFMSTEVGITYKPYNAMDDAELADELKQWEDLVKTASGFASAYFAAEQVRDIVDVANRRGLGLVNKYPIRIGQ